MKPNDFTRVIETVEKDSRLTVWHLTLLTALLLTAFRQGKLKAVKVSRSRIMALSHISTLPTYHKYFKDLQQMGYISYRPSYHPGVRSEVDIERQP
jgi:hypothetical protein